MFSKIGRDPANEVAREFCRRSEYFYSLYLDAGDEGFTFTSAHVDAYVVGEAWARFRATLAVGSVAHRRAMQLESATPRMG